MSRATARPAPAELGLAEVALDRLALRVNLGLALVLLEQQLALRRRVFAALEEITAAERQRLDRHRRGGVPRPDFFDELRRDRRR